MVLRWDRFSRNAPEAYNTINRLAKLGIEVNAIEQPIDFSVPEQKMMLSFYLTIPEVENDRRAMNTINGMRKNKKQGRFLGVAPFGYKNARDEQDRPILLKSEQAPLVKKAFDLFATGNYPIDALRKKLNPEGLKIGKNQFYRFLRNPVYCGLIEIKAYRDEPEELVLGIHEPIISEDLFYEVKRVIEGKKKFTAKITKVRDEFPMRGFLICSYCGRNLTASCSQGRNDKYYYYHCQTSCKERIPVNEMHHSFEAWLNKISLKPEIAALHLAVMEDVFKVNEKDRAAEIVRLENGIKKNLEMLDKATKKLINDDIDKIDFQRIKDNIQNETADLKSKVLELKETESGFIEYIRFGLKLLENLPYYYNNTTLEGKQQMLGSIFPEKLIFSDNTYRTAQPSEIMELLCNINGAFKQSKKRNATNIGSISSRVPEGGLEPPHLSEYAPQTYVSTNSTIRAIIVSLNKGLQK